MDTRAFIRDNYDALLAKAKTMRNFDEDTFQNTMLYIIVNAERIDEATIYHYVLHALKTNFIREKKYARNRKVIYGDIPEQASEQYLNIDESIIHDYIYQMYGNDMLSAYIMRGQGYSVKEISQKYPSIKNLRNKLTDINKYVSRLF